jgi:hypothetical protein
MRIKFNGRSFNKARTDKSLERYLVKQGYEYDLSFRFREDSLIALMHRPHKPGWKADFRMMSALCFDDRDSLIMNWTVCEGFLDSLGLLDTFPPRYNGPFFPTSFGSELDNYLDHGKEIKRDQIPPFDICFVVYWARFMGDLNRESIRKIDEYRNRHPDKKVLLLLVAIDRDKGWKHRF